MMLGGGALALVLALPGGWSARWAAARLTPPSTTRPGLATAVILAAAVMASASLAARAAWPNALDLVLGWTLLALAVADVSSLRLPDLLTLPLVALGLAAAGAGLMQPAASPHFAAGSAASHLIGAGAGYGAFAGLAFGFRRLRGVDGLGLGDAKLAAAGGAWLGWAPLPLAVLLGCGLAFAAVLVRLLVRGRGSLAEPLAFGAPLAAAIWICWLLRPALAPLLA